MNKEMKILKPKFEIIEQAPGMEGMLKHIELCGRTCYKSHDKITENSAEKFVERMKSLGHGSVLEHATIYLKTRFVVYGEPVYKRYKDNIYSKTEVHKNYKIGYITTNYRVMLQGYYNTWDEAVKNKFDMNWLNDLEKQVEPTNYHHKRVTVRFTTDIGISREFNRHRANSISEQSTRYCNYSKDKFGGEVSVVAPLSERGLIESRQKDYERFYKDDEEALCYMCDSVRALTSDKEYGGTKFFDDIDTWLFANLAAQWSYMRLTNVFGWSAQEARSILPLCTATDLIHTAFVSDWINFFKLRCDSHAHPMARELAIPLREEFVKRGLIKE